MSYWDSSNVVSFTERPDPRSGLSYFVIASGGYFCNVFLREDMNLLFQPQPPKEWTSRIPLTREQIARKTTRLNEHCEARGLRLERVPDRSGATPRVSTVEVLETDVGGGRAIIAVRNGYIIKEDLKPLGFKWGGTHDGNPHREWRIPSGLDLEERRAIARKIDMACAQVTVVDLKCKYFPLMKSLEVAPTVTSAAAAAAAAKAAAKAAKAEAGTTEMSGVPEVHNRELVPATILRASFHDGVASTEGVNGGAGLEEVATTVKTEISQPTHPVKNEAPPTTTAKSFPTGGDGNGKDSTNSSSTSTSGTETKRGGDFDLEKVAPTVSMKTDIFSPPLYAAKNGQPATTFAWLFDGGGNENGDESTSSTSTSSTSTSSTSTSSTNPSSTNPSGISISPTSLSPSPSIITSKGLVSSSNVGSGERRLFVFGQRFNIGSKGITSSKQKNSQQQSLFRPQKKSSMTAEGSTPSMIEPQPGSFSTPPTRKYSSSSSSSTTSANSAASPASGVKYPRSPVRGNKQGEDSAQRAQDLSDVILFAHDNIPQKESPDVPLFVHNDDDGDGYTTSTTSTRSNSHGNTSNTERTRDIGGSHCSSGSASAQRDISDNQSDAGVDINSDSDGDGVGDGAENRWGSRRLVEELIQIPLVCREPPSWVSLAFSGEPCQPRFSPMLVSSGGEGREDEEGVASGDGRERAPFWPSTLHSVEVSVGGRGLQARRGMHRLLSSSSGAGGPLEGVLIWRKETRCWWTTTCGTQLWGSKRNVTLDFLRASLKTMSALVVGVEFRDLTEGAERAPPLRCHKHDRDLVEEEEGEEEKDLEKAILGGVFGPPRSRTRRMVSICPVNRESCTLVPHDGLLSERGEMLQRSGGKRSTRPSNTAVTVGDKRSKEGNGGGEMSTDETEKAGRRVVEMGQEMCSSFAKRLNMDTAA